MGVSSLTSGWLQVVRFRQTLLNFCHLSYNVWHCQSPHDLYILFKINLIILINKLNITLIQNINSLTLKVRSNKDVIP